jgi:hypothetical protein
MTNRFFRATLILGLAVALASCGGKGDKPATTGDSKDTAASADKAHESTAGEAGGMELASDQGEFSVKIPEGFSNPEESTMPLETAAGKLNMKVFTSSKGEGAVFMTAYIDYPDSAFRNGEETMLDGAREGALKNLNGQVVRQESKTLDGNPGRSVTFTGKSGATDVFGRVDYYLVKPRLYQVLFLSQTKEMVDDPGISASFDSFKLKKKQ